ncbi:unnamed protein product [Mucor hiemalis]
MWWLFRKASGQGSFGSDDYHPARKSKHHYRNVPTWPAAAPQWMINDTNVSKDLKQFRKGSEHINNNSGNMSDLRVLSLFLIFPFLSDKSKSVTRYMAGVTQHGVTQEIDCMFETPPNASVNVLLWCESLRTSRLDWAGMKSKCVDVLNTAAETGISNDTLASYVLFDLAPRLVLPSDHSENGEDTFVKSYLECFLDTIFSSEEMFFQSWANVVMNNKSEVQLKPDWAAYVKPWLKKVVSWEVKPPSKVGRGDISDFVKLSIEMKDMVNEIIKIGVYTPHQFK